MIRKFEVENFMSLKNVSVDLGPLTVFIGPNGSGKSALFKALVILSRLLNGAPVRALKTGEFVMEAGVTFDDIVYSGNSGLPIKFRVWFDEDEQEPGYILELKKDAGGWGVTRERIRHGENWIEVDEDHPFQHPTERGTPRVHTPPMRASLTYLVRPFLNDSAARAVIDPVTQLAKRFGFAYRYRPSASDIASVFSRPTEPGHTFYVAENGRGVAVELQDLQGSSREVFEAIEGAVCGLFPHIKAFGFRTDWRGVRLTFRTDRSEDLIPAPQESDGVLLATFLFWRLYTAKSSMKVCLEEPENGLHAFLLAERFQALKNFAYGSGGLPGVQLLVATHSPEFLRAVKSHKQALWNEIRLVEFTPGAGTSVRGLKDYREAANLIEEYLVQVQEKWKPIIEGWGKS
ncbi:MAG: ATP-binding protein [Terriglobia bacterium]